MVFEYHNLSLPWPFEPGPVLRIPPKAQVEREMQSLPESSSVPSELARRRENR